MRFFTTFVSGLALVASAVAQTPSLGFTSAPTTANGGTAVQITYVAPNPSQPVTITLRKGNPNNLDTVQVLGTATGGTFTWTPDRSLVVGSDYALEISQGTATNYYGPFSVTGVTGTALPSASASATASASASASASGSSRSASISASVSSAVSSLSASVSSSAASVSSSVSSSSASASRTTSSSASAATSAPTNAAVVNQASPAAFVFGAVAAMMFFQ